MILRQNIHMGIFNGAAMKEAVGKAKALEFEKKKKELHETLTRAAWCGFLSTMANWPIRWRD